MQVALKNWSDQNLDAAVSVLDEIVFKAVGLGTYQVLAKNEQRLREKLSGEHIKIAKSADKALVAKINSIGEKITKVQINKLVNAWSDNFKNYVDKVIDPIEETVTLAQKGGKEVIYGRVFGAPQETVVYQGPPYRDTTPINQRVEKANLEITASTNVVDKVAVEQIVKGQKFWVGKYHSQVLNKQIQQITNDLLIEQGLPFREASKKLAQTLGFVNGYKGIKPQVKIPKGWSGSTLQYFDGLAANASTVSRIHGSMTAMMELGIIEYTVLNPIDERTCFEANAKILMGNGEWKPICEIKKGDEVFTRGGSVERVVDTFSREAEEWSEIGLEDGSKFKSTSDHRIAIEGGGWEEAKFSYKKRVERFLQKDKFYLSNLRGGLQQTAKPCKRKNGNFLFSRLSEKGKKEKESFKNLQGLRKKFSSISVKTKPYILRGSLRKKSLGKKQNRFDMCLVRERVQAVSEQRRSESLFLGLSNSSREEWRRRKDVRESMQEVWEGFYSKAFRDEETKVLFKELLHACCIQEMPYLWEEVQGQSLGGKEQNSLLPEMLFEINRPNVNRNKDGRVFQKDRSEVSKRSKDREISCRFFDREVGGRSGRGLLAQQAGNSGEGQEERQIFKKEGLQGRETFGEFNQRRGRGDFEFIRFSSKVIGVNTYKQKNRAYDIEVENDHSFIVYPGVVVHNCARCSAMHGETLKVEKAYQQIIDVIGGSPADVKTGLPWLSETEFLDKYEKGGASALQKVGAGFPPFHFRCRCSIDMNDKAFTKQVVIPSSAKIPPKKIPITPPGMKSKAHDPKKMSQAMEGRLTQAKAAEVRNQLDLIIEQEAGSVSKDVLWGKEKAKGLVQKKSVGAGIAGKHRFSDGLISMKSRYWKHASNFMKGIASNQKTSVWQSRGFKTLIHESLHGASNLEASAYHGIGMVLEEVATESAARRVMIRRYGFKWGDYDSYNGYMLRTERAIKESWEEVFKNKVKLSREEIHDLMGRTGQSLTTENIPRSKAIKHPADVLENYVKHAKKITADIVADKGKKMTVKEIKKLSNQFSKELKEKLSRTHWSL